MRSSFGHRETFSGTSNISGYAGLAGSLGGATSQELAQSSLKSNIARYFAPRRAPRSKVLMSAHTDGQIGDIEIEVERKPFETLREITSLDDRDRDACGVGFVASIKGERTNDILQKSLEALSCNDHRGGCNYDGETGDGAGIMAEIPWFLIQKWAQKEGIKDVRKGNTVVGQFFLEHDTAEEIKQEFEKIKQSSALIYVSHNMKSLRQSCDSAIFLNQGNLVFYEDIKKGIQAYKKFIESADLSAKRKKR